MTGSEYVVVGDSSKLTGMAWHNVDLGEKD
jgi:hypothetical protein